MLKKYTKDSSGFSLMELMMVIALISIMSAIAAPNFLRSLAEQRLKNAARNLYADMQRARLLAVKENRTFRVRFDTGNNFYYFDDNEDSNFTAGEFRRNLSEDGDVSFGFGKAQTDWENPPNNFSDAVDDIAFFPTGNACSAENSDFEFNSGLNYSVILLQNQNQDVCYAVITTTFGAVQIRRFNGSGWDEQ